MTIQNQYSENLRQAQETWVKAVESWTSSVQDAFNQTAGTNQVAAVDPNVFIDQYFDLAQRTLDAQREVAKNMAKASQAMGENLRKQAEAATQSTQQ